MRKWLSKVSVLVVCFSLVTTGVAWAHVVVSPEEVPAGEYVKMVVTVPTEKEIPTTEVRAEVPEGFVVSGVQPVPGWEHEFEEEEGGVVTAVVWSGGEIGPREFQEFALQAQTPETAGEFSWGAVQTYEDGSTAEWTGPEDSEEPASVIRVVAASSAQEEEHGAEEEAESGTETAGNLPDSGGMEPAFYFGSGCVAVALVAAMMAALRRLRA